LQVLEVGCGLGTDAVEFARSGADYTGIDLTQPAVQLTKQKLEAYSVPGTTKQADAEDLPFDDESFDVVYSWGVIHHTPNTDKCVKEMYRVLRPGGRMILMLYHKNGWLYYRICLHWALLSLLRFNTVAMIAHQLFGADYEKINRWNELYRLDKEQAFQRLVARETDEMESGVNPHSKYYSRRDMYRLLADFENVQITCAHWLEMPVVERLLGQPRYRQLIRWFGSFNGQGIYAIAKKPG
jgi:ubiquinone/menaquinone biosynthesis C-methylase UbiE